MAKRNFELKELIQQQCGSLRAAAEILKINNTRLSSIIHGWIEPTPKEIHRIQKLLGPKVKDLL
jgi:plasmid maintenance system antidote protein VapI